MLVNWGVANQQCETMKATNGRFATWFVFLAGRTSPRFPWPMFQSGVRHRKLPTLRAGVLPVVKARDLCASTGVQGDSIEQAPHLQGFTRQIMAGDSLVASKSRDRTKCLPYDEPRYMFIVSQSGMEDWQATSISFLCLVSVAMPFMVDAVYLPVVVG